MVKNFCAITPKAKKACRAAAYLDDNNTPLYRSETTDETIQRDIHAFNAKAKKLGIKAEITEDNAEEFFKDRANLDTYTRLVFGATCENTRMSDEMLTNIDATITASIKTENRLIRERFRSNDVAAARSRIAQRLTGTELEEVMNEVVNAYRRTVIMKAAESQGIPVKFAATADVDAYLNSLDANDLQSLIRETQSTFIRLARRNKALLADKRDYYYTGEGADRAKHGYAEEGKINPNREEYDRRINEASVLFDKVFGPIETGGKFVDDIFYDIFYLAIPTINKFYDKQLGLNGKFRLAGDFRSDADVTLEDMEKPAPEGWSEDPDEQSPSKGMAPLIYKVLARIPKYTYERIPRYTFETASNVESVTIDGVTYKKGDVIPNNVIDVVINEYENGAKFKDNDPKGILLRGINTTFVTNRKAATTKLCGQQMLSNPQVVARRLWYLFENCCTYEQMLSKLKNSGRIDYANPNDKGEYAELIKKLEDDPIFRNTFVTFFNKYHQGVIGTVSDRKSDGSYSYKTPKLNQKNKRNVIEQYVGSLTLHGVLTGSIFVADTYLESKRNKVQLSHAKVLQFRNYINSNKGTIEEFIKNNRNPDINISAVSIGQVEDFVQACFAWLSLDVNSDTVGSIVTNTSELSDFLTNITSVAESFVQQINKVGNDRRTVSVESINNLKNLSAMAEIIRLARDNDTENSLVNMFSFAGKKQSSRILPSSATIFFKKMRCLPIGDARAYLEEKFLNSAMFGRKNKDGSWHIYNPILRDLYGTEDERYRQALRNNIELVRNMGVDDVASEDTDRRQHILINLSTYYQDRYSEERKKFALIPPFITGDNNSSRFIRIKHKSEEEAINDMYELYLSDQFIHNQQVALQNEGFVFRANDKEAFTSKNSQNKFGTLEFLNKLIPEDRRFTSTLSLEQFKGLITGTLVYNNDGVLESPKEEVKAYLGVNGSSFEDFYSVLKEEGLLEQNEEGKFIHLDALLRSDNANKNEEQKTLDEDEVKEKLYDYFINLKIGSMAIMNMSQVSTLFFNGVEDTQKRNKGYYTNGYAVNEDAVDPKTKMKLFAGEKGFNQHVVYFGDIKLSASDDVINAIRDTAKEHYMKVGYSETEAEAEADALAAQYRKNTITDGEAYRSLESYRAILASIGQPFWSSEKEKAYQRIVEIINDSGNYENNDKTDNLTPEAFRELNELMLVMQPIKPINDGIEDYDKGNDTHIKIPFQLKYAEVPIVPQMYPKGSMLRQMGEWMASNKIDLMASTKCLKKGSFGELDLQYKMLNGRYIGKSGDYIKGMDAEGNVIEGKDATMWEQKRYIEKKHVDERIVNNNISFDEIVKNNGVSINGSAIKEIDENGKATGKVHGFITHVQSLESMLIQNNVPDHSNSDSILGSQGRKIVDNSIVESDDVKYHVGDIEMTGTELKRLYNKIHSMKYAKSFESFVKLLHDPSRMTENILFNILNNDRSNPALAERIKFDKDGNPEFPIAELGTAEDLSSNIISMFKRFVVRQTIEGGSVVQASSLGVGNTWVADQTLNEIVKDGKIVGYECEMPFDFSYVDAAGRKVSLDYETYCNPDGTFRMVPDGKTLIESQYPGILDIVAYRIPTEYNYSMFTLKIKRVTPKGAANTIKLPVTCTTRAGFDFDIDKLFLMRHNYKYKERKLDRSDTINEKVWNAIYEWDDAEMTGNSVIYKWLAEARMHATEEELDMLVKDYGLESREQLRLHHYWYISKAATAYKSKDEAFQIFAKQVYGDNFEQLKTVKYQTLERLGDYLDEDAVGGLSTSQLNNAIVDMYIGILSHPVNAAAGIVPGGFDNASESARFQRVINGVKANDSAVIKAVGPHLAEALKAGVEGSVAELKEILKNDSKIDYMPEYDYSDIRTSVVFKEQNQAAEGLIGIFANSNVNAFISSSLEELEFSEPKDRILFGSFATFTKSIRDGKGRLPIEVDGIKQGEDGYEAAINKLGHTLLFKSVDSYVILKELAQMLAASVDAVKNPVLNYMNLNTITADAAGMLLRMGYTTDDITLLFNQPIIREACDYMRHNGIKDVSVALKHVLNTTYTDAAGARKVKNAFKREAKYDSNMLTHDALAKQIFNRDNDTQLQVAILFNKIIKNSQELSQFVQSTRNTSSNILKSRFADAVAKARKEDNSKYQRLKITAKNSSGSEDLISGDFYDWNLDMSSEDLHEILVDLIDRNASMPFEYENVLHNIIRSGMDYMISKYTPYYSTLYSQATSRLEAFISPSTIGGDALDLLFKSLPVLQISTMASGEFNPTAKTKADMFDAGKKITNAKYYIDDFIESLRAIALDVVPEELKDDGSGRYKAIPRNDVYNAIVDRYIKYDAKSTTEETEKEREAAISKFRQLVIDNNFLNKINFKKLSKGNVEKVVCSFTPSFNISPEEKSDIYHSFEELYKEYPQFAIDLFTHFCYVYGMDPVKNRLMDYAPSDMLSNLVVGNVNGEDAVYTDLFKNNGINENTSSLMDTMLYKFMLTNSSDPNVVKRVSFHKGVYDENVIIINEAEKSQCILSRKSIKGGGYLIRVRPMINIDGHIFVAEVNGRTFGEDGFDNIIRSRKYELEGNLIYKPISTHAEDAVKEYVTEFNSVLMGYMSNRYTDEELSAEIKAMHTEDGESEGVDTSDEEEESDSLSKKADDIIQSRKGDKCFDDNGNALCGK